MRAILTQLLRTRGVSPCSPADPSKIRLALEISGLRLPADHFESLSAANGLSIYEGYFRLFGAECSECQDLITWNQEDTWKFSWDRDLTEFVCFGETAWGDQYAYKKGKGDSPIYFLDAFRMEPEVIAENFQEFLSREFVRCANKPYDELLIQARNKVGRLDWSQHVTYIPSPLLGGEEDAKNITVLNARASMIANGDLATQCRNESADRKVRSLESYTDRQGRARIRVNWA